MSHKSALQTGLLIGAASAVPTHSAGPGGEGEGREGEGEDGITSVL